MRQTFILPAGVALTNQQLGWFAYSVRIDNMTSQYLQEQNTQAWIAPYTFGTVIKLPGVQTVGISLTAPPGKPEPAVVANEYAVAVYSSDSNVEIPGLEYRENGPYYFRTFPSPGGASFTSTGVPPHGLTTRWSYAPIRAAMVESLTAYIIRDATGSGAGFQRAVVTYIPAGGSPLAIVDCYQPNGSNLAQSPVVSVPAFFMQPNDQLVAQTSDSTAAGTGTYVITMKRTEFDWSQ